MQVVDNTSIQYTSASIQLLSFLGKENPTMKIRQSLNCLIYTIFIIRIMVFVILKLHSQYHGYLHLVTHKTKVSTDLMLTSFAWNIPLPLWDVLPLIEY